MIKEHFISDTDRATLEDQCRESYYHSIELITYQGLRYFINNHLPSLKLSEYKDMVRLFKERGYVEV